MKQRSELIGMIYRRGYPSRRQFAKAHGFQESLMSLIGSGRLNPDMNLVNKFCRALKCKPEEIFSPDELMCAKELTA